LAARGRVDVLLSAAAFAAGVPASKLLLAGIPPLALSAACYLAAGGFALLLLALSRRRAAAAPLRGVGSDPGAPPTSGRLLDRDWPWLAGAVLCGGVLAPIALFAGLTRISGHAAGLLLNFEVVFTVTLGMALHGERLGRRGWLGASAVWAGALVVSWPGAEPAPPRADHWTGPLLILASCALWGLDNNLTLRVSLRDARQIVAAKGLVGGALTGALAAALGQLGTWTPMRAGGAAALGVFCFGLPIALFVRALRRIGVLQTGALFAVAPGLAAALSWIALGEPASLAALVALAVMGAGALLVATDHHAPARAGR
jgi:drug/metabolite transporter (DMT)-like permease